MEFRKLRPDEIEVRVGQASEKGCSLLLYKTARTDADILDETVGTMNWECHYEEVKGNLFCGVTIIETGDDGIPRTRTKWDCGTESNMEAEKGEASDAFKRACFKWGIGRELYTAPFIWVGSNKCNIKPKGSKHTCYDRFEVTEIGYEDNRISSLTIRNVTTKKDVFTMGKKPDKQDVQQQETSDLDYSELTRALEEYGKVCEDVQGKRRWAYLEIKQEPTQKRVDELAADVMASMVRQCANQ